MEHARVVHGNAFTCLHERQHEAVVREEGHAGVAIHLPHAEVRFEEPGDGADIGHGQVDVIELHRSPLPSPAGSVCGQRATVYAVDGPPLDQIEFLSVQPLQQAARDPSLQESGQSGS